MNNLRLKLLIALLFLFHNFYSFAQNKTIETTGDVFLYTLPIASLASSFIINDTKGSWQFTKGLLLTEAATFLIKTGVNKERPDGSNNNSFPSGHTSTTF